MERQRSTLLILVNDDDTTIEGTVTSRTEILASLLTMGFKTEDVEGIESSGMNKWYIVFTTQGLRNRSLGRNINIDGKEYELKHPTRPTVQRKNYTKVRVYNYPLDSDRIVLEKAISFYGRIIYIRDMYDRICEIKTGGKEYTMELEHEIPSYLYAGKYQVKVDYAGQTKTCRKCKRSGHMARECTAGKTCNECGSEEHVKRDCPNKRCYHCYETGHIELTCPKYQVDFPTIDEAALNEGFVATVIPKPAEEPALQNNLTMATEVETGIPPTQEEVTRASETTNEEITVTNEEITVMNEEITAINEVITVINEEITVTNEEGEGDGITKDKDKEETMENDNKEENTSEMGAYGESKETDTENEDVFKTPQVSEKGSGDEMEMESKTKRVREEESEEDKEKEKETESENERPNGNDNRKPQRKKRQKAHVSMGKSRKWR